MCHVGLSPGSRALLRVAAAGDGRIVVLERPPPPDQALIDELLASGCIAPAAVDPSSSASAQTVYVVTEHGYRAAWSGPD